MNSKKSKLILLITLVMMLSLAMASAAFAAPSVNGNACTTIQSGDLTYSASHYLYGEPLQTGYNGYGYNYQAHMFHGSYANTYLGTAGYPPYAGNDADYLADNPGVASAWYWAYRDVDLIIQWNDAWLSNVDCDGDGSLDRHYGHSSYIGSGAWQTNHMKGSYELNGMSCNWEIFTKFVAVPEDATLIGSVWYSADGVEIGTTIWDEFAIVQDIYNDPCGGFNGIQYLSEHHAGFGGW